VSSAKTATNQDEIDLWRQQPRLPAWLRRR